MNGLPRHAGWLVALAAVVAGAGRATAQATVVGHTAKLRELGSSDVHNCMEDIVHWADTWSPAKSTWCCAQYGLGCSTTQKPGAAADDGDEAYDCRPPGLGAAPWSDAKSSWCCKHKEVGCAEGSDSDTTASASAGSEGKLSLPSLEETSTTVSGDTYDCEFGFTVWRTTWSTAKMSFCCQHWDDTEQWPKDRPGYCCQVEKLGCSGDETGAGHSDGDKEESEPAGVQFHDCNIGFVAWRRVWSAAKMSWCCHHWDQTDDWPKDPPDYCCLNEHVGCKIRSGSHEKATVIVSTDKPSSTQTTTTNTLDLHSFDCEENSKSWTEDWTNTKKDWCCRQWENTRHWHIANGGDKQQEYCCMARGYGCPDGLVTTSTRTSSTTKTTTTRTFTKTTTIPTSFNCQDGILNWRDHWSPAKREYCCLSEGLGCPKNVLPTTTTLPPTSTSTSTQTITETTTMTRTKTTSTETRTVTSTRTATETATTTRTVTTTSETSTTTPPPPDATSTSTQTVTVTTTKTQTMTTTTTLDPAPLPSDVFDCKAGALNWKEWWSPDKKEWCCNHKGLGCSPKTPLSQEFQRLGSLTPRSPSSSSTAGLPTTAAAFLAAAAALTTLTAAGLVVRARASHPLRPSAGTVMQIGGENSNYDVAGSSLDTEAATTLLE